MKIIAISQARLNSTRCKHKMIRPFDNTTLVEIAVKRLLELENFSGVYFGAYDNQLLDIAYNYLPDSYVIKRSKEMANSEDMILSYSWIKELDFDYCMWINCCHAHLRAKTLNSACSEFKKLKCKSMTSVKKYKTGFYNHDSNPINHDKPFIRTQDVTPIYGIANAFHIFEKKHFFHKRNYWNNEYMDPYLYEVDEIEALDVDSENEFLISESVYKIRKSIQ